MTLRALRSRPTASPDAASCSPWRSLRHPSMRLWTAANTVSGAGTWMQMVAQNLLVLQLTGSVAMTGLSLSAQAAPGLLLGVLGGAVADRYPRRLVVTVGQLALAGVAFATAALAAADLLTVALVMGLGVISGIVATADGPAATLLGNELVPREDVSSAIAVGSVASNAGRLAGTALAALTVANLGISAAYVANGVSFLLVAACVPFLRRAATAAAVGEPAAPSLSISTRDGGVRAGLRYLVNDPVLLTLLVIGLVTSLLGRNFTLTMAALVTGPLAGSAADYGRVGTALAIGGILGGVLAGRFRRPRLGIVVALAGATAGLQAVVGLSPGVLAVLLVAVPMAAAEGAMATAVDTMVQTRPPEQLRGRVLGAWRTAATAWGLAGPIVLGSMLQLLGARAGLVVGGLLIVLALVAVRVVTRPAPVRASVGFAT